MYSNDDFKKTDLGKIKKDVAEDIFSKLGADNIPEEEKGALLEKMINLVQTRVLLRISEKLSDEDRQKLTQLGEQEDPQAIEDFLNEKEPNVDQLFQDEANKLKEELIIDFSK